MGFRPSQNIQLVFKRADRQEGFYRSRSLNLRSLRQELSGFMMTSVNELPKKHHDDVIAASLVRFQNRDKLHPFLVQPLLRIVGQIQASVFQTHSAKRAERDGAAYVQIADRRNDHRWATH